LWRQRHRGFESHALRSDLAKPVLTWDYARLSHCGWLVPLPVPGKLFWSVTVYDAHTRSQIQTGQAKALLSSLFDFPDAAGDDSVDLFFGPAAPAGHENQWIQTNPGAGWFVYFRIYGPEQAAFDKAWKPGDFQPQA
jgi:hypothetical protein